VTFVSITQHFNTNTSMGRLTLNILLSFAQFEREIISERTRDKMGAARKRGQWIGGVIPYGYQRNPKEPRKIIINDDEAVVIKRIFDLYLNKANSALEVVQILNADGCRTRPWTTKAGKVSGKNKFSITHVIFILKSYTYIGKVNHNKQIYPGQQPAIIDEETFNKVQAKLASHRLDRKAYKNKDCSGLLSKLLKCSACGSFMVHTYTLKKGRHKYRYYLCSNAQKRGYTECPNRFVNAQTIENAVINNLKRNLKDHTDEGLQTECDALLSSVWDTLFFEEKRRIMRVLIQKIDCDAKNQQITVTLNGSNEILTVDVKMKTEHYKTRALKKRQIENEPDVRKMLVFAHHLKRLIDQEQIKDLNRASQWLGFSQSRLSHILGLLLLSPSIQTDIMTIDAHILGNIPEYKARDISAEVDWQKQNDLWLAIK
jgi:hypothetical protein